MESALQLSRNMTIVIHLDIGVQKQIGILEL